MTAFEEQIGSFALHLIKQVQSDQCSIQEKTEAMKVLTSYYALLLKSNVQRDAPVNGGFSFADTSEEVEGEKHGGKTRF